MDDNESISPSNPSPQLDVDGRKHQFIIDTSGHVAKPILQQFYFVKLWPTDPDSISQIKKEQGIIQKLNQEIRLISDKIKEKMLDLAGVDSRLKTLYYWQMDRRSLATRKGEILNCLYMALDELCFTKNAQKIRYNKTRFEGDLDNHNLNALIQHGRKSLAEEKKILRGVNIQQRDVASFESLEKLKKIIQWSYYENSCQKLMREIEQFQIQKESAGGGNASVKGKIPNYVSLRKAVKDQINVFMAIFCNESSEIRRQGKPDGTIIQRAEKELEAINQVIHSLRAKMEEKQQKKDEAYDSIFKLRDLHDEEISSYYKYSLLKNKVHQLAEDKDIAALEELSHSEVGKFMHEWNTDKAFREDYDQKVQKSLERRHLSIDGHRKLGE